MFADAIRLEGLRILAAHRIEEGIDACVRYARDQNSWGSEKRTPEIMKILLSYGARAKAALPELQKLAERFEGGEKNFPKDLSRRKAQSVRETIQAIGASTETPDLLRLGAGTPK
jgi:iron-sulfur cluster repair protein YtfE (RIC family)